MIRIGICDDNELDRKRIHECCEAFFSEIAMEHQYLFFDSGEAILEYCDKEADSRIQLLFLDVEMSGINGIEVKNVVIHKTQIWRIVFVSSHKDSIYEMFGLKTIGFVRKPFEKTDIRKWIEVVKKEWEENVVIELDGCDKGLNQYIKKEDILYLKAEGNYVKAYIGDSVEDEEHYLLLVKKLAFFEHQEKYNFLIRTHKSYMVNLENIKSIVPEICLRGTDTRIPVGRTYKDKVKAAYIKFGMKKVKERQ